MSCGSPLARGTACLGSWSSATAAGAPGRFSTTRNRPSSSTTFSICTSTWSGATAKRRGSARTSSYSSRVIGTTCSQSGLPHSHSIGTMPSRPASSWAASMSSFRPRATASLTAACSSPLAMPDLPLGRWNNVPTSTTGRQGELASGPARPNAYGRGAGEDEESRVGADIGWPCRYICGGLFPADCPPSIGTTAPVTNAACSEQSHSTT